MPDDPCHEQRRGRHCVTGTASGEVEVQYDLYAYTGVYGNPCRLSLLMETLVSLPLFE